MDWKEELISKKMFTAISEKTGITYKVLEIEDTIKFIEENFTLKVSRVQPEVGIANGGNKLTLNWMEDTLIGGDKVFYLDESHGVIISYMGDDGYIIKFAQRVKENDKYYCRVVKKFEITPEDFNAVFDSRFSG